MNLLQRFQELLLQMRAPRVRKTAEQSAAVHYFEHSRLVAALIFVATVAAIVLTSFVGVSPANLPIQAGQAASVRITSSTTFTYDSEVERSLLREDALSRVPPVFRLDFGVLDKFQADIRQVATKLDEFEQAFPVDRAAPVERTAALARLVAEFDAQGPYRATLDDFAGLLAAGDSDRRRSLLDAGLVALREIYAEGVHDGTLRSDADNPSKGAITIYQIVTPTGEVAHRPVQSMEEALAFLRISLAAEGLTRGTASALFRLFRNGLVPNLVFDDVATQQRRAAAVRDLRPVPLTVKRGDTIIEPGTRVTPAQAEMLEAHRAHLLRSGNAALEEGLQLFGRTLLVLGMVLAGAFYLRLEERDTLLSNSRLGLLALVLVLNLGLVRALLALSETEFFLRNSSAASALPYLAPVALAPMIVAVLLNSGVAMFLALFLSLFTSVIFGQRLDLLVCTFVASTVAIYACRNVRRRGRIVRAGILAGCTLALSAVLLGFVDEQELATIGKHLGAAFTNGLLTGVAVVGLLPLVEGLFKRTTDITLLELTDYNHPLLRLMQLESPGSYHHSLVVAQLSESAANAIGANPLLARVCALFHDIGKTVKPEFFSENQLDGLNPHDEHTPSFSALIIKSHVKEGVDLAIKHKLPRPVVDVIQQHHGTSLIRYFYHRAVSITRAPFGGTTPPLAISGGSQTPVPFPLLGAATAGGARLPETRVCETTYRYDGPRPQFKESAIIMLADGVEAATRSLRRVTPQHLGELIEGIVTDRTEDGQLDDAPLTFADLQKIKTSFTFTLLNMLHGRVAYPGGDDAAAAPGPRKAEANG